MRHVQLAAVLAVGLWAAAAVAADGPAGVYEDDRVRLALQPDPADAGRMVGDVRIGGHTYPVAGRVDGRAVSGQFEANGTSFPFRAEPTADGGVQLTSGGKAYALRPVEARPGLAPKNDFPAGYTVVKTTEHGLALVASKPAARSVGRAIGAAADDWSGWFDRGWTHGKPYADGRDKRTGLMSLTADRHGRPVRGIVTVRLQPAGGADVAVVVCRADATAADWAELTGGGGGGQGGGLAGAVKRVPLRTLTFPDNTGSIGIAAGYRTEATSCANSFVITGPAGQTVMLAAAFVVSTPDSMAVQLFRQTGVGRPPLIAPYASPAEAIVSLSPQLSQLARQAGVPGASVDHVQAVARAESAMGANGRAGVVAYGVTTAYGFADGREHHLRAIANVDLMPTSNDSYLFWANVVRAPDATFAKNLPAMLAMVASWRCNGAELARRTAVWQRDRAAWFDGVQAANADVQQAYARHNAAWRANANVESRVADNYSEAMRGYTTMADTTTGERTTIDYGRADQIVERMNETDPGRYVVVPLRDDLDPVQPR